MHLRDIILNPRIALSLCIHPDKTLKCLPAIRIPILNQFCHHILAKQENLSLISDSECRIKVKKVEMLPNHAQTETVDRRDLRVMDQS